MGELVELVSLHLHGLAFGIASAVVGFNRFPCLVSSQAERAAAADRLRTCAVQGQGGGTAREEGGGELGSGGVDRGSGGAGGGGAGRGGASAAEGGESNVGGANGGTGGEVAVVAE